MDRTADLLSVRPSLRLADLARDLGIERHTIERAVHTLTGLSFRDYRKKIFADVARRFITENATLSVKEIADKLGYKSQFAFSRAVKNATGYSPTHFRR